MALSLSVSPSVPMLAPPGFTPSISVSALDVLPDVPFSSQVTVTRTTLSGDTITLEEGTDYSYNGVTNEVFFFIPLGNDDVISFAITPDYSVSDLSTQFSDLGVAPAEGSNLRDRQLLQMARDLDSRILALGGQAAGGGTSAGVSSLVVGSTSYDGTIQLFAGTGLSFLEGSNSFQIELDSNIVSAPGNIATLNNEVSTLDADLSSLTSTVGNIYQVPDSSAATVGHVLTVNNSNQAEWQAPTGGSGGGGGATTLNGLNDVTLSSLIDGDILVASGGNFVNQTPNFLTSGDVSAVALDNDYDSLTNLPNIPNTTGTWNLITDRPGGATINVPSTTTLQSGYTLRWDGTQFVPAVLDIADINVAGNQPVADLISGTREPVLEYDVGNANKVLGVSSDGSGLQWVSQAAGGSGGVDVFQATLDNTNSSISRGNYGNTNRWDWGTLTSVSNFDDAIVGWSEDITVGTTLGSLSNSTVFTVASTGTYRLKFDVTLAIEDSGAHSYHCVDVAILRKLTSIINGLNDDLLVRAPFQTELTDVGITGDDRTAHFTAEKYVSLNADDEIYFFIAGNTDDQSEIGVLLGNWIIEKVG